MITIRLASNVGSICVVLLNWIFLDTYFLREKCTKIPTEYLPKIDRFNSTTIRKVLLWS